MISRTSSSGSVVAAPGRSEFPCTPEPVRPVEAGELRSYEAA